MTLQGRPIGITVLAILWVIVGVLWISAVTQGGGLGLLSIGVAGLFLALGYGTWALKPWAWAIGIGAAILELFVGASTLIRDPTQVVSAVPSMVISALIIWYLRTTQVKAAFGRT
jgi:hypothetical protein